MAGLIATSVMLLASGIAVGACFASAASRWMFNVWLEKQK
jgi:hypothetical protein